MADQQAWGAAPFTIHYGKGERHEIVVAGRCRWALEALIAAKENGCTPIDTPGPRWSGYVHVLRGLGVPIETITETHGGSFRGIHARYVLRACVARAERAVA